MLLIFSLYLIEFILFMPIALLVLFCVSMNYSMLEKLHVFAMSGIALGKIVDEISIFAIASFSFNMFRFVFYIIFQLVLFLIFNEILNLNSKRLKLAMINCGSYILISLLFGLFVRDLRDLFHVLFPILVLTTFLSPFVLYKIPITRKLIERVVK